MTSAPPDPPPRFDSSARSADSAWRVGLIFLKLGLTSFGGPVAHLGYFRTEFVQRRRWLSEAAYAELVALCQFLPGPASSQVGMALGLQRAGYAGAAAAWAGFTLPSAIALIVLALGLAQFGTASPWVQGALQGLKVVAVAVVAQAVWGMARTLTPDAPRRALAVATAALALLWPAPWTQVGLIALAGALGACGLLGARGVPQGDRAAAESLGGTSTRLAVLWLALFVALLPGLPLLAALTTGSDAHAGVALVDAFYRAGALVFGGGHVVLPLLQAEAVPTGWVSREQFLAGYGAAQAVPGPLFTFAAFLGAARAETPTGWVGGFMALGAIFAPAFLLVAGALPFWERLRHNRRARQALSTINAAVVGLLLAGLIDPVGKHGLTHWSDVLLAATALLALMRWKIAPWAVVLACAVAGAVAG